MFNLIANPLLEKFLAIFILIFFLLSGYFIFTNIYFEQLHVLDRSINLKKQKTAKLDSILSKEKELMAKINIQKNKLKSSQIFLTNKIPSTASSELQNKIKRIISSQTRAKILTTKPYPSVKHENYTETSIEVRMKNIQHSGIQKILYKIENELPLLIIKELEIKRVQLRYKALVKSEGETDKLEVILVVSAFFREELS